MRIDVHAHYVPPQVLATLEKDAAYQVKVDTVAQGGQCLRFGYGPVLRPFLPRLLDLDQRWEVMQQQGVDRQLLSVWPDIFGYGMSPKAGSRWHRLLNETLCETAQRQPERFGALASVPLQDPYNAAEELSHAVEQCGAIGGIIGANIEGRNLDDPPLDPFWAAAEALDVPLFLHPIQPLPTPRTGRYYLNTIAHYVYDTTVAIGCLIFSGVLGRFPRLQIILAHGGGFFPYQVGRFDQAYRNVQETSAVAAQRPSAYLGGFFYDTIVHDPTALRFLIDLVGVERLLLGSDYPFPVGDLAPLQVLESTGLSTDDRAKVAGGNAQLLFRL